MLQRRALRWRPQTALRFITTLLLKNKIAYGKKGRETSLSKFHIKDSAAVS